MEKSKNTDDGGLEFTQIAYFYNKKVTTANKKFNNHLKKEEPKKRKTKKKLSSAEEDTFKIQNSISSSPISLLKELVYETNRREPMQSYTLMCLFAEFFTFFEETKEVNEYMSQYINDKNCDFNEDVISGIHKIYNTDITANRYHLSWLVKMVIRTKKELEVASYLNNSLKCLLPLIHDHPELIYVFFNELQAKKGLVLPYGKTRFEDCLFERLNDLELYEISNKLRKALSQ